MANANDKTVTVTNLENQWIRVSLTTQHKVIQRKLSAENNPDVAKIREQELKALRDIIAKFN